MKKEELRDKLTALFSGREHFDGEVYITEAMALFAQYQKHQDEERVNEINQEALKEASAKLRKLRLTDIYGEKDRPSDTVKSVFQAGLGGMYDDEAVTYALKFGIKYYLEAIAVIPKEDNG